MSIGNIAIKGTAYDAVIKYSANVKSLTDVDYTQEEYYTFEESLLTIAMSITSNHDGGKVGHAGLLLSDDDYGKLVGTTPPVAFIAYSAPPETITYPPTAEKGELQMLMEKAQLDRVKYYTQEGCGEALRDLIMKHVPEDAIIELKHTRSGYNQVTAKDMMSHLKANSRINDVFDKQELLTKFEEPIDFTSDITLKAYFKTLDEQVKVLEQHGVKVSVTVTMVRILGQIKAQGDFKEDVAKWETKAATAQTYAEFKKFFTKADHERRQRDKYVNKTAASLANTATGHTTDDVKTYIDDRLSLLATALRGSINEAMQSGTAAAATTNPTPTTVTPTSTADLNAEIAKLKAELGRLKANTGTAKPPRVKCPHCNRYHPKIKAEDCWALETNKAKAPAGWAVKGNKQT